LDGKLAGNIHLNSPAYNLLWPVGQGKRWQELLGDTVGTLLRPT
jgi:hypothetical protein